MKAVHWDLWLAVGILIGVVTLGIWAIFAIKRWREETAFEVPPSPDEQLEHYEQMVDDGSLDPAEFARIKARLVRGPEDEPPPQAPDTSFREL